MISSLSSLGQLSKKAGGGVVASAPLWVAVGDGSLIVTSTDGSNNWTALPSNKRGNLANYVTSVAYGKDNLGANLWVAVGAGSIIAKSSDGQSWIDVTTVGGSTGTISFGRAVAYANGLWVAGGDGGSRIAFSSNGINWTPANNVAGITRTWGISYGNGNWIAVCNGVSTTIISTDGSNWSDMSSQVAIYGRNLAYGNNKWIIVGDPGGMMYGNVGTGWVYPSNNGGIVRGYGVAYGKDGTGAGLWVVVGTGSVIATSADGTNWSAVPTINCGGLTAGYSVAYGKDSNGTGLWVAIGAGSIIVTSQNGSIWRAVPSVSLGGITTTAGYGGVAYKP